MNEAEKLQLRLNARNHDIEDIIFLLEKDNFEIIKEFREALDSPTEEKVVTFYKKIDCLKHDKIEYLRFSLMIENHFHEKYADIPSLDHTKLTDIFKKIVASEYLTTIDYQFIGDFTVFLARNESLFSEISKKLTRIDINELYHTQKTLQFYFPQALTNVLDILIDQHKFLEARRVLKAYRRYIDYFNDHQYKLLADYFEYRLNYFSANSLKEQEIISSEIAKFLETIQILFPNMSQTKQIEKSYKRLKNGHSLGKPLYYFRKF